MNSTLKGLSLDPLGDGEEEDEDEIIDVIHSSTFHKERKESHKWQFYDMKDVPPMTSLANSQAASQLPGITQETSRPETPNKLTYTTRKAPARPKAPLRHREKLDLKDDEEEEGPLQLFTSKSVPQNRESETRTPTHEEG